MDLRRPVESLGRLSLTLGIAFTLFACAGKSSRDGGEDDDGRGGTSNAGGGTGGSAARGGTSGTGARGGTGTGGTSNSLVTRILQNPSNKIDLLFMIDNSVSMADKQRILSEAVPVLVQRIIDPICIDADGEPIPGTTASTGCNFGQPEFTPIQDIHIGVITSSLGNHGGQVCTPDPAEMPPRNLNDAAQLLASVRIGLYSYQGQGFLAWDPRMGQEIPPFDPHPGKGANETDPSELVMRFAEHVSAAGERGCAYEASLEAWYRFLVDPEPVNTITNDGQFTVRGPVNQVVLEQRARFLRPDSILGIVMLTDENDCSVLDENGAQGWLVGSRNPMPRGSDACAHPEDPNVYRCCIPCVLLSAGAPVQAGCDYSRDVSCNTPPDPSGSGGHYLTQLEDSTNLRCYDQVRRFGVNWLYPAQRYVDALTVSRIALRPPSSDQVTNPIFTPGVDGTPARDQSQVFLAGIVGVPWQDIATESTLAGRALRFQTSQELTASGRWDVILGDPAQGIPPTDPFMLESIDARTGLNPITGDDISAPQNDINGHEANIVNRDDLQYACTFDLVPDTNCTMANQDGCDCNAAEQAYDRPTCQYAGQGTDGVQTHAKAYPSTRQLQVLRGLGDNAVVASICPKNVMAMGDEFSDPDYGYNPAVGAMIARLKQSLRTSCLVREFETNFDGELACDVVEARLPQMGETCSCAAAGRAEISSATRGALEDELTAGGYCGSNTGFSCSDYCLCEIDQFAGDELNVCQNVAADPGNQFGFCYVDPDNGIGNPELTASCPDTQRRLVRFMGPDLPAPNAAAFIVCQD